MCNCQQPGGRLELGSRAPGTRTSDILSPAPMPTTANFAPPALEIGSSGSPATQHRSIRNPRRPNPEILNQKDALLQGPTDVSAVCDRIGNGRKTQEHRQRNRWLGSWRRRRSGWRDTHRTWRTRILGRLRHTTAHNDPQLPHRLPWQPRHYRGDEPPTSPVASSDSSGP